MFNIIRKKKGRKRKMPEKLIKEFIGKTCTIILFNNSFGTEVKIIDVEDNWVKVEDKNVIRLINGDLIQNITLVKDKKKK